jgi:hypothetical protein
MNLVGLGGLSRPALGDLDGDGDLDLLAGSAAGTLRYFEHTGTAVATAFVERSGAGNPFDGVDIGSNSAPALIDVEGDGDLDVVVGRSRRDALVVREHRPRDEPGIPRAHGRGESAELVRCRRRTWLRRSPTSTAMATPTRWQARRAATSSI